MRTGVLLALVAVAFASRQSIPNPRWLEEIVTERRIEDREFQSGREYRFVYDGQIATGIPGASKQHAATRIQAVVSLIFTNAQEAKMKLTHIRMAKLNREIPTSRLIVPFEACEQVSIEEPLKNKLHMPVQFKYNKGMIVDIEEAAAEEPWSLNIKRGVLNALQVNLQKHRRTDMAEEARLLNSVKSAQPRPAGKQDHFTVMEETMEGDCEIVYTVTERSEQESEESREESETGPKTERVPGPRLLVVKSVNFEKCKKRPDIRYNFRFTENCPTCEDKYNSEEKALQSSSVTRFEITGTPENFIIEEAKIESHYTFAPAGEASNVIQTTVKQQLKLVHTGPVSTEIASPANKRRSESQMIYSPEWDIMKEEFFMEGEKEFGEKTPYSEIRNKAQFAKKTLKALVRQMRGTVKETAPRQFARLVKLVRMCKSSELQNIHQKLYKETPKDFTPEEHKMVKDLLIDALAIAGTKDSVHHLCQRIKDRQVSPVKGAIAIKALINTRVVSKHMIDQLLALAKEPVAERNPILRQSCLLTAGSMMNALCVDNEDKLAKEFEEKPERLCPRQEKEKFVEKLVEIFEKATNTYERVLALKTMSNAGLDMSIFELEKIIENRGPKAPHSILIRTQAIEALRQLLPQMPRKVQRILMPLYMQRREPSEIRMSAVYQVLQSQPPKPVLDQIAGQLARETSRHVASFVYTQLRSMANSTEPCQRRVADDLKLSLRLARHMPISRTMPLSKYWNTDYQSEQYKTGISLEAAAIKSPRSSMPKDAAISVHTNMLGSWQKYLATVGMLQMNADELLWNLIGSRGAVYERSWEQLLRNPAESLRRSPRSLGRKTPREQLEQIFDSLKIEGRRGSEQELTNPFAMLYLRWKDQEYGLLPFSTDNFPESISKLINGETGMQEVRRFLASGYHFDVHSGSFITEWSRKIPTSIGMPLEVSFKVPTVVSVRGSVRMEAQPENSIEKVKIIVKAQPSIVSTMVTKVECLSPIVNSGLKVIAQAKLHVPVDAELEVDSQKSPVEIKFAMKTPEERVRLATLQTYPVTMTRVWPRFVETWEEPEEKTVFGKEWNRVNTIDRSIGENAMGLKFRARGEWHHTPSLKLPGTPCPLLAGPNKIEITCEPGQDAPKEIVIKLTGKAGETLKDQVQKASMSGFYEKAAKKFFGSEEKRESESSSEEEWSREEQKDDSEEMHKEWQTKYESRNPIKRSMKVEVIARGAQVQRKAELEAEVKCGEDRRHCLYKLEILRTPVPTMESEPWKMIVESEMLYPETPYEISEVFNKKTSTELKMKFGPVSGDKQNLRIRIEGEHSREQERLNRERKYQQSYNDESIRSQHPDVFSPVAQYEELLKAGRLTQFKLIADYKIENPTVKYVLNRIYRAAKNQLYPNTIVEQTNVRNPENEIRMQVNLCPKSFQLVNVTARLPRENVYVKELPLPMPISLVNIKRSRSVAYEMLPSLRGSEAQYESMAKCKVQSNRIQTFDEVVYRVPLTTCYSVLAKDCSSSQQSRFAVMLKKLQPGQESQQKKIKIISEAGVVTMEPKSESNLEIKLNGEPIELTQEGETVREHGHIIMKEGPYVKVSLPEAGVKVYFDGYTASIKISEEYKNMQCGLCGDYNQEQQEEYRLPNREFTSDRALFHSSYLHRDAECQVEEEELKNEVRYDYRPYEWELRQEQQDRRFSSSSESSEESRQQDEETVEEFEARNLRPYRRRGEQPELKTKVIENGHELCFSKVPVPVCPSHTYAASIKKEKKVVYSCLPRSDVEAELMQRRALREEILTSEVQDLPPSFTETELVPELCREI